MIDTYTVHVRGGTLGGFFQIPSACNVAIPATPSATRPRLIWKLRVAAATGASVVVGGSVVVGVAVVVGVGAAVAGTVDVAGKVVVGAVEVVFVVVVLVDVVVVVVVVVGAVEDVVVVVSSGSVVAAAVTGRISPLAPVRGRPVEGAGRWVAERRRRQT